MFNLTNKYVKLEKLTTRTEGADIPAATLTCEISMSNDVLNDFSNGLLKSLYEKQKKEQVELINDELLPDLRYQELEEISWSQEFENVILRIPEEVNENNARFIFTDCTLKKFKFGLKQGGSVAVKFNINCKPEGDAIGWLYSKQKQTIPMTLEAGETPQLEGFDEVQSIQKEETPKDKKSKLSPKADMVATFIHDKPGSEVLDISNHFQLTMKKAETVLSELVEAEIINKVLKGYFIIEEAAKQA